MPTGIGRYGPIITGFSNTNPGVLTVYNSYMVSGGETIRVAAVADDQSALTLNGTYTVASITNNSITLNEDTTSQAIYISGGFVTVLVTDTPSVPNPPNDIFSSSPDWYNQASQI